jgi:predicted nuclease of predicted toxin-antitoxin system
LLLAATEGRVIVWGETDFGGLFALLKHRSPSVILFRSRNTLTAEDQAAIILDHLDDLEVDLDAGAVVVVSDDRLRVRLLPLLHDG